VTCGDVARPARVVALIDTSTARVEVDGATEEVALDLVDARVGDVVLVHAGVAIGTLA
jgi:hydrogenase maturation factor